MRREIHQQDLLQQMLKVLMEILEPYLPACDNNRLVAGRGAEATGHTQYGR